MEDSAKKNTREDQEPAAKAFVSETEAVLIDNHGDGPLKALFKTSPLRFGTTNAVAEPTENTLMATSAWDSSTRRGEYILFSSAGA
jgi:hypothetical protein